MVHLVESRAKGPVHYAGRIPVSGVVHDNGSQDVEDSRRGRMDAPVEKCDSENVGLKPGATFKFRTPLRTNPPMASRGAKDSES